MPGQEFACFRTYFHKSCWDRDEHFGVFLLDDGVEPTNDRAERAQRFALLWRRMMQGSFNEKGDLWVERIPSLRETSPLRGVPTYAVLIEAVSFSFENRTIEVSWIWHPLNTGLGAMVMNHEDGHEPALGDPCANHAPCSGVDRHSLSHHAKTYCET